MNKFKNMLLKINEAKIFKYLKKLSIMFFVWGVISFYIVFNNFGETENPFILVLYLFAPFVISVAFDMVELVIGQWKSRLYYKILKFLVLFTIVFYVLIASFLIYTARVEYNIIPLKKYSYQITTLLNKKYLIQHFPMEIPDNAVNYNFKSEQSFFKRNVYYLSFSPDEKYLEKVIEKNKNNILKVVNYSQFYESYNHLQFELAIDNYKKYWEKEKYKQEKQEYSVYILKNEKNEKKHTFGFVVSKKYNEIIFFYADFDCVYNPIQI